MRVCGPWCQWPMRLEAASRRPSLAAGDPTTRRTDSSWPPTARQPTRQRLDGRRHASGPARQRANAPTDLSPSPLALARALTGLEDLSGLQIRPDHYRRLLAAPGAFPGHRHQPGQAGRPSPGWQATMATGSHCLSTKRRLRPTTTESLRPALVTHAPTEPPLRAQRQWPACPHAW